MEEKKLADGIYLMTKDGAELYTGQAINGNTIYTGVGVKLGNKSLVVAPDDMTEDDFIIYHEAVADWNGKENTDDIRDILNDDIPSLGEMCFIILHIYEINKKP